MTMTTDDYGDFLDGVSARVAEIIDETKDKTPSFKATGLWKTIQSDSVQYNTQGVSGLGYLQIFDQGDSITEDETTPQYRTEYIMKQHGLIVSISQMLAKARPSELEGKLDEVKNLMTSTNRTLTKHAWQTLIDGFSTTDSESQYPISRLSDAVSMFSTAHPSRVSGVANRSNRVASNAILSETNLFTAIRMIREQLNPRGQLMGYIGGFTLVVPTELEKLAVEITRSELKSDSANNDFNYYKGVIDVIATEYLSVAAGGSATAWYVFANSPESLAMRYITMIEPKIEQEVDFNTKTLRVSVDGAWAFGYSSWETSVGSSGLGV